MHLFVHSAVLTTPPLLLLLRLATPAAASANSFYFSFPSKTAAVPLVHNGDVLNVTWFSEYNQASLIHWCGGTNMQTLPALAGDGAAAFTVNASWTGTCHWQLVQQGDADRYVDSGFVDVTNARATPALTWRPADAVETACGVGTVTAMATASVTGTATASATEGAAAAPAAAGAADGAAGCAGNGGGGGLSTGASMGVGVAIGAAAAGVVGAVAWWVWSRRIRMGAAVGEKIAGAHGDGVYQGQQHYPRVHELNPSVAYVEADGGWGSRKRLTPVELPHEMGDRR